MIQLSFTAHNPRVQAGNMLPSLFILSVAFTGLTRGVGLLPDGPLVAATGDSVIFNTTNIVAKPPFVRVIWLFGSKRILESGPSGDTPAEEYEDRLTYYSSTVSLEIKNLTEADDGEYGVQILTEGPTEEGTTSLTVYARISNVAVAPVSVEMEEWSGPVSLTCSSSGSLPSYVWRKGDTDITASDRVQISEDGTKLTITNVTRQDDAKYSCRVSNLVSSGLSNLVTITINHGPENIKLTPPSPEKPIPVGSVFTMKCSAESKPSAQFSWFVNETFLPDVEAELKLTDVKENQSGNYSCRAFNPKTLKNQTSEPLQLIIMERISGASVSQTNPAVDGRTVNLTCEASGSVQTRDWMKGGSDLVLAGNMKLYDNNRVLAFNTVTRGDKGLYVCKLGNPINNMEASYSMVVNYGPENVKVTVEGSVVVGSTVTLKCSAASVPSPNFTWLFNGTEIKLEVSDKLIRPEIKHSDSGNYTCKATNQITGKSSSAEKTISVKAKPPTSSGCGAGCIAGIVIGVIVLVGVAVGVGFYFYQKRNKTKKSTNTNTPTVPGGARDNTANPPDVNYADISGFQKKNGERVRLGEQNPATLYSEVKVNNNNPAAASSLPTYDSHMQRQRTAAPTYAQVQKRQT